MSLPLAVGGPALSISKSAIPVSPSCSWLAAAEAGLTTTPLNPRSRGVTAKQHRWIQERTGRASAAVGEEDIPRMVNLSHWVAKAAQAWRVGGRPANSYRREDWAAAAEAISLTISTGLRGGGGGAGLMAETRAL